MDGVVSDLSSSERLPAPLWETFRQGRQLDSLGFRVRVLPFPVNGSHEEGLDDESHTLAQASYHEYDDAEIPMLHTERLFATRLGEVPPIERPLAMATRVLETCASQGSVRFVCLLGNSECLFRFRHLAHIWIKLPATTKGAVLAHGRKPYSHRWMSAANGMRPALMELASNKKDRNLTASEVASLPDGRIELEPFAEWLREDEQVQKKVAEAWNDLVQQGLDRSVASAFSTQLVNPPNISSDDFWAFDTPNGLSY